MSVMRMVTSTRSKSSSAEDDRVATVFRRTARNEARNLEKHVSDCSACAVKLNELMDQDTLAQPFPSFVRPVSEGEVLVVLQPG